LKLNLIDKEQTVRELDDLLGKLFLVRKMLESVETQIIEIKGTLV
jgi:hypothetical protein